jgi:hypothetical protein
VKSGGEWISSIQLENAAMGHPKASGDYTSVPLWGTESRPHHWQTSLGLMPSLHVYVPQSL